MSTTRRVPAESRSDYRRGWEALAAAVREAGANAWRFQSAADPDRHIEFIEYSGSDPRALPRVATALRSLETAYGGRTDEWRPPDETPDATDDP